ncbi:hypothetical protein DACRYDRAFT_106049 [Dacryopinax primogenitus]|uniref:Uncharacterized protein n=1 Tax=Dacryopinax primogenitus (strain DJM 731) TaxID=1858805 RepID=M5GCH9_DACPD|nr:uncharacterized protein DACRYDRAFT_106049 [Dacryopinax primogenitus]EJU03892.1 hypothetical protein DACRYDRAFT_106049 [Dacryopinax primogenitus]
MVAARTDLPHWGSPLIFVPSRKFGVDPLDVPAAGTRTWYLVLIDSSRPGVLYSGTEKIDITPLADNENNLKSLVQEGEKVYQDYEQGTGGAQGNQNQQGGQQQSSGANYSQDLQDAEAAFEGGKKLLQGEEQNL